MPSTTSWLDWVPSQELDVELARLGFGQVAGDRQYARRVARLGHAAGRDRSARVRDVARDHARPAELAACVDRHVRLDDIGRGQREPARHALEIAGRSVEIDARPVAERRAIERGERVGLGVDDDLVDRARRQVAVKSGAVRAAIGGVGERLRRRAAAAVDRGEQDRGVRAARGRGFLRRLLEGQGRQAVGQR